MPAKSLFQEGLSASGARELSPGSHQPQNIQRVVSAARSLSQDHVLPEGGPHQTTYQGGDIKA